MQRKVSGAKSVIVPITTVGKNYLPYVEYLNNRYIKYIDFVPTQILPTTGEGVNVPYYMYFSLSEKSGNSYFIQNEPMVRFDYSYNKGIRKPIMQKVSLQNSYIEVTDPVLVGKSVLLIFWYDLPEFSQRNKTNDTITDYFEVKLNNQTGRFEFPDNRTMAGKRFRNFFIPTGGITPSLSRCISDTDAQKLYITLQKGNYKVLDAIPLTLFNDVDKLEAVDFANIVFDFTYSYISAGGNTPISFEGQSVLVNATYEK